MTNVIRKKLIQLSFVFTMFILVACNPNEENEEVLQVSPMFEAGSYTMIGEENKIGFIYDDGEVTRFKPNREQKYMWHFWGEQEELAGEFEVVGENIDTGEKFPYLKRVI